MKNERGYKSIETSTVTQTEGPNGVCVLDTQVERMPGVTTEMLVWWFHNFDCLTNWNGQDFTGPACLAYRVWHPRDHIAVSQVQKGRDPTMGGCAVGAKVRIQEKILLRHNLDAVVYVAQNDEENLDLQIKIGPLQVGRIEHLWANAEGGCDLVLRLTVGVDLPVVGRWINRLIRKYLLTEEMIAAVPQHGTEEFGNLENFLPEFYANPDQLWKCEHAAWK